MAREDKIGLGCLVAFLTPFCAVGLIAAVLSSRAALRSDWSQAGFLAVFALTFGGVGFGMLGAALRGRKRVGRFEALKRDHPDEPWLWRSEWVTGRIEDSNRRTMYRAWAFAAFWNLVSSPGLVAIPGELEKGNDLVWLALVFPVIGIGLIVWALRATIRHLKYGVSALELEEVPAAIGHGLRGTIRTNARLDPRVPIAVRLACVRRVTRGTGKNRRTSESVLWEEEREVNHRRPERRRTVIPVAFRLPKDAEQSDYSDSRDKIVWRLSAEADVPGVDYSATFEVPVFRTAASATAPSPEELAAYADPDPQEYRPPPNSRILVLSTLRGIELVFPPARNPGVALGLTAFTGVWTGFLWFLWHSDAPTLFTLMFGLFDLLLVLAVIGQWLGTARVEVDSDSVRIKRGILGIGRTKTLRADRIADIRTEIGMQSGKNVYYRIQVHGTDGKNLTAATGVKDKRHAEWLANRMATALQEG